MKLKEIMTQNVETVGPDITLKDCAQTMKRRNVGVLPVIEGKKPIGVITDRDITLRAVAAGADVNKTKVREVDPQPTLFTKTRPLTKPVN
jgi:CBS domain-containing protein